MSHLALEMSTVFSGACINTEVRQERLLSRTRRYQEMPGGFRQLTLVALVKNKSEHFDCLNASDGLTRASYNVTQSAGVLVYSLRYCVFNRA